MTKINIVCESCGSANVVRDAYAEWDTEDQTWVLGSVYDDAFCNECEAGRALEEVPYVKEGGTP